MSATVIIRASARRLLATDLLVLLLLEAVLLALGSVRMLLSPMARVVLAAAVVMAFGADVGHWFRRGIRRVELTGESVTVYRGPGLEPTRFDRSSVERFQISRFPGARAIRLRSLSGRRLRIAELAFAPEDFRQLLAALRDWEN